MMKTERKYYESAYEAEFEAVVVKVDERAGKWCVVLEASCFYPGGGGQPADVGNLGGCGVVDCFEDDGLIYHVMERRPDFAAGDLVRGVVDFGRRYAFMQNHTGEHVLSGLAKSRFGAMNVGFHMSERGFTIDFDLPLSAEELEELEELANRAVARDVDVELRIVRGEELLGIEARSKKDFGREAEVRLVEVPGYDCCACAALHVGNLREVGIVKIVGYARYKGGVRLNVFCGGDALWDYTRKNGIVKELGAVFSAEAEGLVAAALRVKAVGGELKKEIDGLKNRIFELRAGAADEGADFAYYFEEGLDGDGLRRFANLAAGRARIAIVLSGEGAVYRYAACSHDGEADLAGFAAKLNEALDGRGGAGGNVAQGALKAGFEEILEYLEGLV